MTREDVIGWLEYLSDDARSKADSLVPTNIEIACGMAIDALKAQEPHIMTLEEVKNSKEPMFLETKSFSDWCLFRHSDDDGLWFSVTMRDGSNIHYYGKLYGKSYRLWTSRPDEKRRAETPWE